MIHVLLLLLDLTGLMLLVLYFVQMLCSAAAPARPATAGHPARLNFTFLVPALDEALVIEKTLADLRRTAPGARVVVIDDASGDGTGALVEALAARDDAVRLLTRTLPRARRGKGDALNWATQQLLSDLCAAQADLSREVFVVLDADGRVTPGLLDEARAAFAEASVMGAQARVRIRPSAAPGRPWTGRVLEQQQDLEFFIIRHVQRLRQHWASVGLFGNGQFMRASYLHAQAARGRLAWPDCLSEDFASGLEMRLAAPGNRMAFLEAAVTQQGLPDLARFTRQRSRWTQGTMQCLGYLPRLWSSRVSWPARLDLTYFILSPWLNGVILLSVLTQPVRWLLHAQGLLLTPQVNLVVTAVNVGLQLQWLARYRREAGFGVGPTLLALLGLPVYGFALFLSLPLAYWNHFTGRRIWDKSARHQEAGDLLQPVSDD